VCAPPADPHRRPLSQSKPILPKSFDSFDMVSKVLLVLCALLMATPMILSIPFTDADLDGKH